MIAVFVKGQVRYRGISNADIARLTDAILAESVAQVQRDLAKIAELGMGQPRYVRSHYRDEKQVLKSELRRMEREQAKRLAAA